MDVLFLQLIADFEEEGRPLDHNGGDGASASSTGTTSPDNLQEQEREEGSTDENNGDGHGQGPGPPSPTQTITNSPTFPLLPHQQNGKNDIIVTTRDLTIGKCLLCVGQGLSNLSNINAGQRMSLLIKSFLSCSLSLSLSLDIYIQMRVLCSIS